ncbi:15653_t:CDS:2, partial [Gigaspora margarita]
TKNSLAKLEIEWNNYLFKEVLPHAWDKLTNDEILKLLNYLLLIDSENYEIPKGLKMILLANGKFNKIMKRKNSEVTYLFPHDINESDLCEILIECTDKLIAKDISSKLSNHLIKLGKKQNFNIEVINVQAIISIVKKSLSDSDNIHIVPTTENTLRKLKAKSFLNRFNKLKNITFIPSETIRMAQEKKDLDTIKCRPVDLFDPTNQEIAQLFLIIKMFFQLESFLMHIPTTDKTGQETFFYLRENGCHDKKNKDLVSLVVPIFDYQVECPSLHNHLEWNKPLTNFILKQMHQCSTMFEDDLNFKNRLQICEAIYKHINKVLSSDDEQYLLIPSTYSTFLRHKNVYFDNKSKLYKAAKNYKILHPKIMLELAKKLEMQMLSSIFLKCSQIEFEALEHFVLSTTRIKNVINNADDAGAQNFSIYLDERILDKNSKKHSLLSRKMHNWQGPTVWIYYNKKVNENNFSNYKNQIDH